MKFIIEGITLNQGFNKEGDIVEYSYRIKAFGLPFESGAVTVQAFDLDTGDPVTFRGYPVTARTSPLSAGGTEIVEGAPLGFQPPKNWNVEFRVVDDAGIIQDRTLTRSYLVRPPEPDEVIPDEGIYDEETDTYIQPFDDEFIAVIPSKLPVAPPDVLAPTEYTSPALPWYAAWLEPVIRYGGELFGGIANFFSPLVGVANGIGEFLANPMRLISENIGGLFKRTAEESIASSLEAVDAAVGESPEWKVDLGDKLRGFTDGLIEEARAEVSPEALGRSPLTPEEASTALTVAGVASLGIHTASFIAGVAAEAATLGQLDGLMDITDDILRNLGLGELSRAMVMYPLEPLLLQPARYHWNAQFTPMIPEYADLIQMVVREVIDIPTFKGLMAYQGYSETYSQYIWDAHFIAPSLGQLLIPFRRGLMSAEELTNLQILVDLDPRYNAIWEQQWYHDPTPRQGRFMLETGAIDASRLRDIVVRSGLHPDFVDSFTEYMVKFQERPWRRRYLVAVASGYRRGVFDASRVESDVVEAGYSADVAKWIIAAEDVQKEIDEAKVAPERVALISVSYATDAFINDDVDEDWLREYFSEKGYRDDDIEVALGVLVRKRDKARAA